MLNEANIIIFCSNYIIFLTDWKCHHYTDEEKAWSKANSKGSQEMCEHFGGFFSQGNDKLAPGCGTCWCCKPLDAGN